MKKYFGQDEITDNELDMINTLPFVKTSNIKSTIAKVGGTTKITVDFLGMKKGAVEIPRSVIKGDLLSEFETHKY